MPRVSFPTFNILSPGSKPEIKAALSGCIASTDIPGSGSNGIPIVLTLIIKIKYASSKFAKTPAEITIIL